MELLSHRECLCLVVVDNTEWFSEMVVPVFFITINV